MIQSIIDGIIAALLAAFPGAVIYTDRVKQGFKQPCFILRCISPKNEQYPGSRYRREGLFSVQYIPAEDADEHTECYAMNDSLFRVLEYITVGGDLLRGTNMRGEHTDGVLTFMVNYNAFVKAARETVPMEDLTVEVDAMETLDAIKLIK